MQCLKYALILLAMIVALPVVTFAACGNNVVETGEACDGSSMGFATSGCSSIPGYKTGTLVCKPDCSGFDISSCTVGNTIDAASCSQSDVQSAINSASDGDTINVPAGTCAWTTAIIFGDSRYGAIYQPKSLFIKGAGIDQTIIIDQMDANSNQYPVTAFSITLASGKPVRVTGFTFDGSHSIRSAGPIGVGGPPEPLIRIDHNKFINLGGTQGAAGILTWGAYGVIDHNTFNQGTPPVTAVSITGDISNADNSGNVSQILASSGGNYSWDRPLTLGTINAMYMEDNNFVFPFSPANGGMDAYDGARYVMRYNTLTGTWGGHHGFDSGYRGVFSYEVYNNTFTNPYGDHYGLVESRSGTGVLFNNVIVPNPSAFNQGFDYFGELRNYRSSDGYLEAMGGSFPWNGVRPWNGVCDGTFPLDGNTPGMQGYPCRDQNGRTTGQTLSAVYGWNNNFKGTVGGYIVVGGYGTVPPGGVDRTSTHIVEGRDYFNTPSPTYVPYVYPHPLTTLSVAGSPILPPVRSNGAPTGTLAPGTTSTTLSLQTDINSNCKYSTSAGTFYAGMTNFGTTGSTSHSSIVGVTSGNSYNYYVRCAAANNASNYNTNDYAISFSVAAQGTGNSYYVDGSNPACVNSPSYGSESQPLCTIGYGIGKLSPGDTLYVKQGTYNEALYINSPSGTSSNPVTVRTYPGHNVIIRGPGFDSSRVKIINVNYMIFEGFEITNFNQGLFIEASSNIIVRNCNVHDVGQEGIHILDNSAYITIENCAIHDTRRWQYNGEGVYAGTGSTGPVDNSNNIIIRNNVIYNVNDEAIELKPGTHDSIVEGNIVYNATTDPGWNAAWGNIEINEATLGVQNWATNPNHIVRNNTVHDTKTGIRAGTGSLVYNNVVYNINSPWYGIYIDNNAGDPYTRRIYHNTVDVASARAVVSAGGQNDVKNNIGPTSSSNIATSAGYFAGAPNYHLAAGGAPVNAGVDLSTYVLTDKDGNPRPQGGGWDMGAYEFVSSYSGIILRGTVTRTAGVPCPSCTVNFTMNGVNGVSTTAADGRFSTVLSTTFAPGTYNSDIVITDGATVKNFKKRIVIA